MKLKPIQVGVVECEGRQNLDCKALLAPFKFVFVRHGRLGLDRAGQWFELGPGEAFLMNQHERSRAAIAYPPDLIYYWLLVQSEPAELEDCTELHFPRPVARPGRVENLFQLLLEDQEAVSLESATSRPITHSLLAEMNRFIPEEHDSAEHRHIENATSFIRSHFREPISTREVSDHLRLNPDYLGRIFRKISGKTIVQQIQEMRLKEARLLLLGSDEAIGAIAANCGFSSDDYFRRMFSKIEGISPGQFRDRRVSKAEREAE